jgi:gamma-glutamyltranspeptidase/glutathione hydrolase
MRAWWWIPSVLLLLGAGPGPAPPAERKISSNVPSDSKDPLLNQGPKKEALGDKAMVATQLPIVTETALQVLREGGNAADAFITAVFMQHVNDYHQVSFFGAMTGLYYEAATGKYYAFNAFSDRPLADRGEQGDPAKVAIGGTVRGLEALAKRFGTRPWASYLEPAIASAEEGVLVTSFMYANNYQTMEGELRSNKEAREFYMPEGHLVPVGFRWKMPKLAETMRRVAAEGADYLYTGAWGQKFVKEAIKRGGRVAPEDLAEYQVRWMEPVRFTYRGHEIIGEPPPGTGGLIQGYSLNILENFDLKKMGPYTESADTLELMSRTFGRVEDELRWALRDPLSFQNPSDLWLSKDYGKLAAQLVRKTTTLPGVSVAPARAAEVFEPPAALAVEAEGVPVLGSNHNVIADAQGNWITALHTGHGGAPGVFIDGVKATGSGMRGETTGPGRRIQAGVAAVMVAKNGVPWMAIGTPGWPPQPITEVLVNVLDFGMAPKDAADAPRFWAYLNNQNVVEIETRVAKDVRDTLKARGIKLKELGDYNWHTGSMQIIWRDAQSNKLHGVTDPRRLGLAAGF